jgi:predicted RecB family nuclease
VQLLAALGTEGTIVVFTAYERTQLGALADGVPGYRRRIGKVQERLLDLHRIVKEHYYHPDLDGSFSLKALVPAVVPKLSYGAITSGQEAAATYEELLHPATSPSRRVTLERALRRYCRTDTLAMVKLWQTFRRRAARVAGAL